LVRRAPVPARSTSGFPSRLARYAPSVLLPVFAVVTTVLAVVEHGPVRAYWALGAVVATLGTALFTVVKDRQEQAASSAAVAARNAVTSHLVRVGQPIVAALGDVTGAENPYDRRAALDVLVAMVIDVAVSECGRETVPGANVRSVYYELADNRLERRRFGGRRENVPRKQFLLGNNEHDNEVVRLARGEEAVLVEDLENAPPPYFVDNRGRSYKSFVACPIRAGTTSFGLLSVDSDIAHGLTDVDRGQIVLLAGALAAGLACCAGAAAAGRPPSQRGEAKAEESDLAP
jgi:hypothetical protein